MKSLTDLHSPKHVALALGVSESSLKRWCDQGLIRTSRTAGGHRKVQSADVIRFARERGLPLVTPELLGLPDANIVRETDLQATIRLLADALLTGNELLCRQIVLNLAFSDLGIPRVFDDVLSRVFVEIGEQWACRQAAVYQERRGCEIVQRILAELRKSQSPMIGTLTACGGTASSDSYSLPTTMVEIVLRDSGFEATSLGTGIPFDSLVSAVHELRPHLFWLSATHIPNEVEFLHGLTTLSSACAETQSAFVIGGRALTSALREQLVDITYCEDMQHLARFARTLVRIHQRSLSRKSRSSQRGGK